MADNVVDILLRARMEAGDVASGISSIQKALNGLTLPKNVSGDLEKQFAKIGPLLKDYQKQLDKGFKTPKDLKNLELLKEKIADSFGEIKSSLQELNGQEIRFKTDTESIAKMEKQLDGLKAKLNDKFANIFKKNQTSEGITQGIKGITSALNAQFSSGKFRFPALKELTSGLNEAFKSQNYAAFNSQLDTIKNKITSLSDASKINIAQSLAGTDLGKALKLDKTIADVGAAKKVIDDFFNAVSVNRTSANGIERLNIQIKDLQGIIAQTKMDSLTRGAEAIGSATGGIDQMAQSILNVGNNASQAASGMLSMQQQVDQLKTSTQYFFGLRNMINLLKRGISQAVDTIKELDAAMTETAVVVPEWNIGDMWAKLPEYTQNANQLGAKVVDLYKATTLYYQQGLRGNEVMDVAAETMKMARIGGLEAADATDKMTAALRGFNMEINATSAQRVNDVYSNLAANTASNTEELGTAMQRTASIAASAGMSFEGTAAFLAQAIETTREPAENLGTAMKTIVARFTELKKNPLEITEVDGEEVSYNKVDTALQSIGVSLKDTNGQFRDLDQVFLDISQRWDGLTQTQQRYIATQAAGSRQQSRFIAMMSNYKRTQELMDFANNSEGASQEQFEKTLDSLEAKLAQLGNAWDKFLMGITDNQIVKGAVDGLTTLIGGVNKLIDTLSLGLGPLKSFMSLMTAFIGLKMGGRIVNSLIGGLGGLVDPTSGGFMVGLRNGALGKGNPVLASQIYTPIVAAIKGVASNITPQQQQYRSYVDANRNIQNLGNNFKINDLTKQLNGVSGVTQKALISNNSGSFKAATRTIMSSMINKAVLKGQDRQTVSTAFKKGESWLANQRDTAEITAREYYAQLRDPALLKNALIKSGVQKDNPAVQYLQNLDTQFNRAAEDSYKQNIERIKSTALANYDKAVHNGRTFGYTREELEQRLNSDEYRKSYIKGARTARLYTAGQNPEVELTKTERFLNGVGKVSGALTSAGLGLQSFGSQLQQSANPAIAAFGATLSTVGSTLSAVGMAVSGLTNAVVTAASTIGLIPTAILAAIAVIYMARKAWEKHVKQQAEEITTNYKEDSKKHEGNINNLNDWRKDLARLSGGVDKNGNNINLESSDYQRYLEIADGIAKINPEIVKGYNAQGHAIIDNNTALEKTLALEQKHQKQVLNDYTSKESMDALVAARNLSKENIAYGSNWRTVGKSKTQSAYTEGLAPQADMLAQAKQMAALLQGEGFDSTDFKQFGIDLDALANGEQEAVAKLQSNFDSFVTHSKSLMQSAGTEISEETQKTFDKAVKGYNKAAGELDDLITPLYEQLSAKMSAEGVFDRIPDEMATFYNQGLKTIAADTSLGTNEIISQSQELATKFENLTEKGSEYDQVMSDIAEAQEKFGENLDADAYEKAADSAVESLEKIKDEFDSSTSYGQALTQFLDNQIAQISDFTKEGVVNVADALNTMTDEITAAEGALESFKDVEEGSNFSTAAEGMKEIYDTITEKGDNGINKHAEGLGDQTYWAGAEALLGRDNLKKKSKEKIDGMLKTIKPMLEEGQKGFQAFYDHWIAKKSDLEKIEGLKLFDENSKSPGWLEDLDDTINPDVYKQVADTLDMSEDMLTSMLNKGRQFGAIDFVNLDKVREGLATSDSIIRGMNSDVKGKKNMYIKRETLNAEFANAGINDVAQQEKYTKQLAEEQGIKVITNAAKISFDEFKDMGIHSQESLISILNDTGQFTKEEIQQYAERYAKVNEKAAKFNKEDFDRQFKADEAMKDPVAGEQLKSLESLDAAVASIVDILSNQRLEEGHLDNPKADALEQMVFGGKGNDTEAQRFWKGKNKEGDLISRKEYLQTGETMKSLIKENDEYIAKLEAGRKETKAGSEERKKFDDELERIKYVQERLNTYYEESTGAYHQANNQKIGDINERFNGLLGDKSWKSFKGAEKGNALDRLYNITDPLTEISEDFVQDLETLGLTVEEAREHNLVTKEAYDNYSKQQEEEEKQDKAKQQQRRQKQHKNVNEQIDQINEKTGGALGDKTWKSFKGKENHAALEEVAQATQEPVQIITDSFVNSLTTLGMNLDQALASGLVTQGAYDVYTKAKALEQQKNDAEQQGKDEADSEATAGAKTKGKDNQKKKNDAEQAGKDEANNEQPVITAHPKPETSSPDTSGYEEATEKEKKAGEDAANAGEQIQQAATVTGQSAEEIETYSRNTGKLGEVFSSIIQKISKGLSGLTKGANEFNQASGTSEGKQGKPPKGTTIPINGGSKFIPTGDSGGESSEESTPNNQTVTLKVEADYTQVTEAKKEINSTIKLANKGVELKVTSTNELESTQKKMGQVQKQASKGVKGKTVSFNTTTDNSGAFKGIDAIVKKAKSTTAKVKVTSVKADGAYDAINALKSYASTSVSFGVNVKPGQKHNFSVSVKADYLGQNNTGVVPSLPNLGSAAAGTSKPGTGRLGPKGKGGLTLTGELGYEVAWLPRQHRSMILGVNGPEMVDLPGDAVVWNHEQSKQIVKRNQFSGGGSAAIGAGSMSGDGEKKIEGNEYESLTTPTTSKNPKNPKKPKNTNKDGDDKKNKSNAKATGKLLVQWVKWSGKAGKIFTWWENISRKVENITRQINKNQKEFEKALVKIGQTIDQTNAAASDYRKNIGISLKLNDEIVKKYDEKLKNLDTKGGSKTKIDTYNKKQRKADKLKGLIDAAGDDGKIVWNGKKISVKKARKILRKTNEELKSKSSKKTLNPAGVQTVSWDDTGVVTTKQKKKGKVKTKRKKVKVKRKAAVDMSKLVDYDTETGTYTMNEDKINKAAGGNKKKAQAIKDKLEKQISEWTSRRNAADDKIDDLNEQLTKVGEEIYDNFVGWKFELDKIWKITQKIKEASAFIETSSKSSDLFKRLASTSGIASDQVRGKWLESAMIAMTTELKSTLIKIDSNQKILGEYSSKMADVLSGKKEEADLALLQNKLEQATSEEEKTQWKGAIAKAQEASNLKALINSGQNTDYIKRSGSGFEFNTEKLEKDYAEGNLNKTTYDATKDVIDELIGLQDERNDALNEIIDDFSGVVTKLQEMRESYASIADEFLNYYEEQQQKSVDNLKTFYDNLSNSFKDLTDSVRKGLDQRRQTEDNAKTESDIAKKQNRLATLQADTSGGHAVEIAQLQQEIADSQQSYGRTLEDQLLSRLEQQADEAAKQRDLQISMMQAQLDVNHLTGANARHIDALLTNYTGPDLQASQDAKTELTNLFNQGNDLDTKTALRQQLLNDELTGKLDDVTIANEELPQLQAAVQHLAGQYDEEGAVSPLETIADNVKEVVDTVNKQFEQLFPKLDLTNPKEVENKGPQTNAEIKADKTVVPTSLIPTPPPTPDDKPKPDVKNTEKDNALAAAWEAYHKGLASNNVTEIEGYRKIIENYANSDYVGEKGADQWDFRALDLIDRIREIKHSDIDKLLSEYWAERKTLEKAATDAANKTLSKTKRDNADTQYKNSKKKINETILPELQKLYVNITNMRVKSKKNGEVTYYKTGGLATQTGPAWLDGTRAKPELVLNAVDTKNFIALKNVLSDVMKGIRSVGTSSTEEETPIVYDIDINVDHISNDYDVDRVAKRVEKLIVKNANYRNVTSVRNLR